MSLMRVVNSIKLSGRSLISGYFNNNFDKTTPAEIIQLCILYCLILDEFVTDNIESYCKIYGLNNTFADCNVTESNPAHIYSLNTHEPNGIYLWMFKISDVHSVAASIYPTKLSFDFIQNGKCVSIDQISLWKCDETLYHIFLDAENNGGGEYVEKRGILETRVMKERGVIS
eukprot:205048_1